MCIKYTRLQTYRYIYIHIHTYTYTYTYLHPPVWLIALARPDTDTGVAAITGLRSAQVSKETYLYGKRGLKTPTPALLPLPA